MTGQVTHNTGRRRPVLKILIIAFGILFGLILILRIFHLSDLVFKAPKTVVNFITDGNLRSDNDRVNILLLGIGGEGHDGPNLSDSMIVASIEETGKDVALINIPRDLWTPDIKAKINAVYALGQEKEGNGLEITKNTISHLFGIPIHYGFRIDFDGFIEAIDLVGGLDLEVENTFTDYRYPIVGKEKETCGITIENKDGEVYFKDATGSATLLTEENNPFFCRYEVLTFKKGPAHLDGKTALKFVRSRHGTGGENSDFARSARQQKVIEAFRQKIFSTETLLNPKRLLELATTFGNSIDTDIPTEDIGSFAKLAQKARDGNIRRIVLDSGREDSLLEEGDPADYLGQFVLVPAGKRWQEMAEYIQVEIFKNTQNQLTSPKPKGKKSKFF